MSKILKVVGASWLQTKISSYVLGILGVLAILALFAGQMERSQEDGNYAATVFYSEKTGYHIEYWGQSNDLAVIPKGVARAYFRMDIDTTGWSILEIETDGSYHDEIQAYAAGIVEGALTWYLIHTHLENTIRYQCDNTPIEKQCNKLRDALTRSLEIWKNRASELSDIDPFWHHVSLHYTQINGILTGWRHGIERSMEPYDSDISDLLWLNSVAEVTELQHKLNISLEDEMLQSIPDISSAFLRIVNGTGDEGPKLFMAQNAAGRYSSMTRILKRYKLNYHKTSKEDSESVPGTSIDFSSYPGSITSQDEFYLVKGHKHRMAVAGTALRNYNNKLWQEVNITEQVPAGPRITAANHLATNVSSWGHIIAKNNSGSASKQWLIVDLNRFDTLSEHHEKQRHGHSEVVTEISNDVKHTIYRSNNSHGKGLVELVEQVPGLTHSADISDAFFEKGYWATYGLPFFKNVAEKTHINKMEALHGKIFSETESPRAVIFQKGYINATTAEEIIKLMRQNNLTENHRSENDTVDVGDINEFEASGYSTVMGVRGDIVDHHKKPYGIIDTKIICATWNKTPVEFIAVSGPPYTEVQANATELRINKGNLAPIYTKEFDNQPTINSIEIRDLVKQQIEEAKQETLDEFNKNIVQPFDWSKSDFVNDTHRGLPDKWAFVSFKPNWSW